MIRRAEMYWSWADIEDIANQQEGITKSFAEHEKTASRAFKELYTHIEKIWLDLWNEIADEKREITRLANEVDRNREMTMQMPQGLT